MLDAINKNYDLKRLNKKVLQLDALSSISFRLTQTTDLDTLLNKIIKYATEIVEGEAASILLLDKEKNELFFKASIGKKSNEIKKYKVKVGEGIAGWVAENGKPLLIADVRKDKRWNKKLDVAISFNTKSIICVPMLLEGEIIGVIEVINRKDDGKFDKDDEEILSSFANQAVIALRNANTVNDLKNYFVNATEILIQAIESESIASKGHSMEVAKLATQIGTKLGITGKDYENLYYASLLHDIGKIKVKKKIDINFKAENNLHLVQDEVSIHPIVSANMLKQINLFKDIVPIVKHHHENYDGTGYPHGLRGDEIPLGSRIIAVVEDYTKIFYNKPIENTSKNGEVLNKLFSLAGTKYDPKVIAALKEIIKI